MLVLRMLLVGAIGLLAVGCSEDNPTVSVTPPTIVTDTFSGSVTKNGASVHAFTVLSAGTVTATATTIEPVTDPVTTVGLAIGTWNGIACSVVIANDSAVQGTIVTGIVSASGLLCVRIYDAKGTLDPATPASYTITVAHP